MEGKEEVMMKKKGAMVPEVNSNQFLIIEEDKKQVV